jgi:hypothetical protein
MPRRQVEVAATPRKSVIKACHGKLLGEGRTEGMTDDH